jgi:CRISPR-associated endonuclease/helicase Cas3
MLTRVVAVNTNAPWSPVKAQPQFTVEHKKFIDKRLRQLGKATPRRMAKLLAPVTGKQPPEALAVTILNGAITLHSAHSIRRSDSNKSISVGLVRMANINSLVAVAQQLVQMQTPEDTEINLCVYHSRHPLLRRHLIESNLDSLLSRSDESKIWSHPAIQPALKRKANNQIFIVLATAVAEVGRDHCYDWAIVEPSSMRSIVQLAGRVMRHRDVSNLDNPNILLLQQNIRSLQRQAVCFQKPGYETKSTALQSHDLADCLPEEHFSYPGPRSCISESTALQPRKNMVDMEHAAMRAALMTSPEENWPASLWWNAPVRWTYQMQHMTRFRRGPGMQLHAFVAEDDADELHIERFFNGEWNKTEGELERVDVDLNPGFHWWITPSDQDLIDGLSEEFAEEFEGACRSRLTIDLEDSGTASIDRWTFHERLGLFKSH